MSVSCRLGITRKACLAACFRTPSHSNCATGWPKRGPTTGTRDQEFHWTSGLPPLIPTTASRLPAEAARWSRSIASIMARRRASATVPKFFVERTPQSMHRSMAMAAFPKYSSGRPRPRGLTIVEIRAWGSRPSTGKKNATAMQLMAMRMSFMDTWMLGSGEVALMLCLAAFSCAARKRKRLATICDVQRSEKSASTKVGIAGGLGIGSA
mmetsp:Transcript_44110/g.79195  ORF Transcript_44110/g.79195 Transcript_44110/m.79195 type:complete len:210 (-) Transcript_44110:622-1251(-)